jgi:sec-independent protein translocase protein TatB
VFNLDPGKLLLVAVVAILVLGPDKLPDAARRVGATWRTFSEFRHRMEAEVRSTIPNLPATGELARLARSPAALLGHLGDMGADTNPSVVDSAAVDSAPPAPGPAAAAAEGPSPTLSVATGDATLN